MPGILCLPAPRVNPTSAEALLADRLAWLADGNDPAAYPGSGWRDDAGTDPFPGYAPGWQDELPVGPSDEDEAADTGYAIGVEGEAPPVEFVYRFHCVPPSPATRRAYYRGIAAGRREHARRVGHALGVAGQFCARPASVHRLFAREFEAGWKAGADEWADRQDVMAGWQADLVSDAQERELERHNLEAGGWYRAWGVAAD